MKIDLTKIPVFVITTGLKRKVFVQTQLNKVGIRPTFVNGIVCSPPIIGCGLSHLKVLKANQWKSPFLVLEDDCAVTEEFQPELDVPNYADIAYLGVSTWGIDKEISPVGIANGVKATRVNEDWLRVRNMLSGHAILYITSWAAAVYSEAIVEKLVEGVAFDIGFAEKQPLLQALTPNNPFFYQADCVGGAEGATRKSLVGFIHGLALDGESNQRSKHTLGT